MLVSDKFTVDIPHRRRVHEEAEVECKAGVEDDMGVCYYAKGISVNGWGADEKGFLITVYMLNVVAWGGMLFLLLVNAAPAMCTPTCNDLYSPRRICNSTTSHPLFRLPCNLGSPGLRQCGH